MHRPIPCGMAGRDPSSACLIRLLQSVQSYRPKLGLGSMLRHVGISRSTSPPSVSVSLLSYLASQRGQPMLLLREYLFLRKATGLHMLAHLASVSSLHGHISQPTGHAGRRLMAQFMFASNKRRHARNSNLASTLCLNLTSTTCEWLRSRLANDS